MAVLTGLLFVVLTPGILLTLPSKASSKLVIAIVHGVVFALVYHFIHTAVCEWTRNYEGFQAKKPVKKHDKKPVKILAKKTIKKPATRSVKKPIKKTPKQPGCSTQLIQSTTAAKLAKSTAKLAASTAFNTKITASRAADAAKTACKKESNCAGRPKFCNF